MTTVLLLLLAPGLINYYCFFTDGKAMLGLPGETKDGLVELAFFVFLWPVQVTFYLLVGIQNALDWFFGRLMG